MKSKLLILLLTIGAGSNVSAMNKMSKWLSQEDWKEWASELASPKAWQAWYKSKTTTKPTEFIMSCLSKSANMTGDKKGLFWKDEFIKTQPGKSATVDTSYVRDGVKLKFNLCKNLLKIDDRIRFDTTFVETNDALNKEHGFDYAFAKGRKKSAAGYYTGQYQADFSPVDKWTQCGYRYVGGKYGCQTEMSLKDFVDQLKKAEQK